MKERSNPCLCGADVKDVFLRDHRARSVESAQLSEMKIDVSSDL